MSDPDSHGRRVRNVFTKEAIHGIPTMYVYEFVRSFISGGYRTINIFKLLGQLASGQQNLSSRHKLRRGLLIGSSYYPRYHLDSNIKLGRL